MLQRATFLAVALLTITGSVGSVSAQTWAGAHFGYDTEFNALMVGGEVRFPVHRIEDFPLTGNPTFDYYFVDRIPELRETLAEISGNAYYEFEWEDREQITPYAGAGLGLRYYSIEESATFETVGNDLDLIVNMIGGATYAVSDEMAPFGHLRLSLGGGTSTVGLIFGLLFNL